jgi:hypothetical protein
MNNIYYRVETKDGTLSGLTSLVSAGSIATAVGGVIVVDTAEYFSQKGREYSGPYRGV